MDRWNVRYRIRTPPCEDVSNHLIESHGRYMLQVHKQSLTTKVITRKNTRKAKETSNPDPTPPQLTHSSRHRGIIAIEAGVKDTLLLQSMLPHQQEL